jgi:2,4-dienoyl-CoA reductase-like NADH-dependent reductase (Old Yellow Enzyme family)
MTLFFTPQSFGNLTIPNRLVRSATAERMADDSGKPQPKMFPLYRDLARGGVGLIISGHMYVHPSGKAHPEMTGIYSENLVQGLRQLTDVVHQEGGLIAAQINHAGLKNDPALEIEPWSPSAVANQQISTRPGRAMTSAEIEVIVDAFGQAARRVQQAGFDAVQIHSAHGYLTSQFLSPAVNQRKDEWGGSLENRMRFLRKVMESVRSQVGTDYPVLIKFGMMDGLEGGLTLEDGLQVVASMQQMGLDAVELSGGFGSTHLVNVRKGIRREEEEAYFLEFAQKARQVTDLPLMLVGGFRSRQVMERVLTSGEADFISICRPLINDPDFPNKLRQGIRERSECLSANNCWAEHAGEGIACKCPIEKVSAKRAG